MATYKDIFEIEKQREDSTQWNVIHLFRDGNSYKAYEWSAWLCREFATSEEWRKQVAVNQLTPVHKAVKQSTGSIIFVGFPMTSIDKFIQKDTQISFTPVGDNRIDIAIELPADQMDEMTLEKLQEKVQEWKKQFPVRAGKGDTPQPTAGGESSEINELMKMISGAPFRPMRMSDILAQINALPIEDVAPNEALKILRILKRQCAALF